MPAAARNLLAVAASAHGTIVRNSTPHCVQAERWGAKSAPVALPASSSSCANIHSARSRRTRRLEYRHGDRFADTDVVTFDDRPAVIAQPDRLGAKREGALLSHLDESKMARA